MRSNLRNLKRVDLGNSENYFVETRIVSKHRKLFRNLLQDTHAFWKKIYFPGNKTIASPAVTKDLIKVLKGGLK